MVELVSFKRRVLSALGKDLLEIGRGLELDMRMDVEDLRDARVSESLPSALAKLGFDATTPSVEGAFIRMHAIKNAKKPDKNLTLPFRGPALGERCHL